MYISGANTLCVLFGILLLGFMLNPIIMGNISVAVEQKQQETIILEEQVLKLQNQLTEKDKQIEVLKDKVPDYGWIGFTIIWCVAIISFSVVTLDKQTKEHKVESKKGMSR